MATQPEPKPPRHVVLIHGLGAHRILMWPLAWYLNRKGLVATTFGYSSWWWSIEHHANRFREKLQRLEEDPAVESFGIVAHSMGSVVTRQALLVGCLGESSSNSSSLSDSESRSQSSAQPFSKLSRVVLLGPPNQGSPSARRLGKILPFCKTVRQISDHPESFVRNLPPPNGVEVGIIAASYDLVIPERNSHLATEKDHLSIFSGHNGLLVRPSVLRQVVEFLAHGWFSRPAATNPNASDTVDA